MLSSYTTILFFVSQRIASRIYETSDLRKALVLSLRADYTTNTFRQKHIEHEKNATAVTDPVIYPSDREYMSAFIYGCTV